MFTNHGYNDDINKNTTKIPASEPAENTPANSFRKLLKNFASDTSFGGISKATLSEGHVRRFIWCLISATCYGFTIYMCYLLVQTYLEKPIKTSVDISYEKNIDFPSVTVCNLNQFRRSRLKMIRDIQSLLLNYTSDKRNRSDGSNFEKSLDTRKNSIKKEFNDDIDGDENIDYDEITLDENVVVEDLVAIEASHYDHEELKKVGHQFNDTVLSCSWKGLDCRTGYFMKFWVKSWNWKYGNCFTFNPGANESGHSLPVFRTNKPGPNYGLSLDINIEQSDYVDALTDEAGMNVIIHNARQMPFPYDEGITVPAGFSSSIAIRKLKIPQKLTTTACFIEEESSSGSLPPEDSSWMKQTVVESITRVDPFKNGSCNPSKTLSQDNIYRKYMKGAANKYSVKACMESCLALAELAECNCSDARFAGFIKNICTEEDKITCKDRVTTKFKNSMLGCDAKCPQPCQHNSYRYNVRTSTMTAQAKETKKEKDFGGMKNDPDFDFDQNYLRIKVFYDELNLQKIVQSTFYDLETLLGDIGGQLGLWIGISVISVAEFGELLISLCMVAARKSRDRNKTKTSEMELR